jgi:hypothetical protein
MGARHGVRLGVSYDWRNVSRGDLFLVAIRLRVRVVKGKLARGELALLRQWIDLNREMIVKVWKSDEYVDVHEAVKSLPGQGIPARRPVPLSPYIKLATSPSPSRVPSQSTPIGYQFDAIVVRRFGGE